MRVVLAVVFVAACGGGSPKPAAPTQASPTQTATATAGEKLTGTITEINFGCAADASCDLVIDGTKRVHFGHDTRLEGETPWGNTEDIFTLMETPNQGVGRRIEVFAAKKGDGYTLQGNEAYYIKVLP